ncbi:MAG: ABC transporter permease, partial [Armatimonadetes bacterium]|nr:ABC transporter permease [Anaerolineae bacterium]
MNKIWTITSKDLRETFTSVPLLLLMFAAPLALATIIAVTFGGTVSDTPLRDIPVALVNLDAGGTPNNGQIIASILTSTADSAAGGGCPTTTTDSTASSTTLDDLLDIMILDDVAAARAGVDDDTYAAAVIIPADFSAKLNNIFVNAEVQSTQIEVYGNPQRPISTSIVRSVVSSILTQISTGTIAAAAVLADVPVLQQVALAISPDFQTQVACAASAGVTLITLESQLQGGREPLPFNPLVLFGASQAIFFALFTANGAATSVMEERNNGTLQRLLVSPTPRLTVMLGKMTATFVTVLAQLTLLFVAFTLVGSLLAGELQFIWGQNLPGIVLIMVTTALATTGLGSIIAAIA